MEVRFLVGDHVRLNVAKGRLGLVLDAFVECLEDVFLEMFGARMGAHHGLSLGVSVRRIVYSQYIHFDAGSHERNNWAHVLRNAGRGVKRDRGPDGVDVRWGYAVVAEKVTGRIRAVDLEALGSTAVLGCETDVMEHRAGVEKLGVEAQAAVSASHRSEEVDAAAMVKKQ